MSIALIILINVLLDGALVAGLDSSWRASQTSRPTTRRSRGGGRAVAVAYVPRTRLVQR